MHKCNISGILKVVRWLSDVFVLAFKLAKSEMEYKSVNVVNDIEWEVKTTAFRCFSLTL